MIDRYFLNVFLKLSMTSENKQQPQYSKKRSMKIGAVIILLAIFVFYIPYFVSINYVIQARLLIVGIMGFLLIYDWREIYFDIKRKNKG